MKLPWAEMRREEIWIPTGNGYKKSVRVTHLPTGEMVTVEGHRESMRALRDRATLELAQRVDARLAEVRRQVEQERTPG